MHARITCSKYQFNGPNLRKFFQLNLEKNFIQILYVWLDEFSFLYQLYNLTFFPFCFFPGEGLFLVDNMPSSSSSSSPRRKNFTKIEDSNACLQNIFLKDLSITMARPTWKNHKLSRGGLQPSLCCHQNLVVII